MFTVVLSEAVFTVVLSEAMFTVVFPQRPHSAGGVRVVPDVQGCRVQGGGAHDARPAQRGMGA